MNHSERLDEMFNGLAVMHIDEKYLRKETISLIESILKEQEEVIIKELDWCSNNPSWQKKKELRVGFVQGLKFALMYQRQKAEELLSILRSNI